MLASPSSPFRPRARTDERRVPRRGRQQSLLWTAISLALATAAVGMFRVGQQALWFDESISVRVAQLPVPAMVRIFADPDRALHAFYEILLHFWQFGGSNETYLRSLSVALGVGTVLTLFALNVRLFDRRTAIASCTLLTVNVFFIRYMQEARPYALVLFLVVTASWCFANALERPSISRWTVYAVTAAAAMWAHIFAGFVVVAHAISMLVRRPRPPFRRVCVGYLVAAVLIAPLVLLMVDAPLKQRPFLPTPSAGVFGDLLLTLTGGTYPLLLVYFAICSAGLIVMARVENRHRHGAGKWANSLVLLWLGVPVVAAFCISFALPIFHPIYLIVVLPGLVTIAGIGISSLPHRALRGLAIAVVVALSAVPLFNYYRTTIREDGDWRAATAYVAQNAQSGDGIVFLSRYNRGPFEYYAGRFKAVSLKPLYPTQPWGTVSLVSGYSDSALPTTVADQLRSVARVWTYLSWGGFGSRAEDGRPIQRVLEDEYTLVTREQFGPSLEVRLYERAAAALK